MVFFGYGDLAVAGLDALAGAGAPLSAMVLPGNRRGPDVELSSRAALARGLPLFVQPPRAQLGPLVEQLRALAPTLIVVWSYSMRLPRELLDIPPRGAVNVHGGTLPEYRGPHVTQWAILNGESEFGVTLHYMDEGMDTGPVIAEQRFPLSPDDDAASVRRKIADAGASLLRAWWPRVAAGTAPRVTQDPSRARYWPLRTVEQGELAWTMPASTLARMVRALCCNEPGAYVQLGGRRISIRAAHAEPTSIVGARPGQVVASDDRGVRVATADGDLRITSAALGGQRIPVATLTAMLGTDA